MRRQELRITSDEPKKKTSETFEIDISDDLFLRVGKRGRRDITINSMVLSIIKDGLKDGLDYKFEHNPKPQFLLKISDSF